MSTPSTFPAWVTRAGKSQRQAPLTEGSPNDKTPSAHRKTHEPNGDLQSQFARPGSRCASTDPRLRLRLAPRQGQSPDSDQRFTRSGHARPWNAGHGAGATVAPAQMTEAAADTQLALTRA